MKFTEVLSKDKQANKGNIKGLIVVTAFRFAHQFAQLRHKYFLLWILCVPYLVLYRLWIEWTLGIELPQKTKVGPGLIIWHGQGMVINDKTIIGANVQLRHNVTIGNKKYYGPCPVIEDDVDIGCGAIILGDIRIGKGAKIGAGAIVTHDVPAGHKAVNPCATIYE
ncbi:MAG: serine acetyltransferase [Kiritimatiellae bacterium]|jgi:serine acetyltransferase|nr:serine acetyltransferase [Kiritimatiellia bacterium]